MIRGFVSLTAVWLASSSAFADSYSLTYFCKDASGRKSVQDMPCSSSQTETKQVQTLHHVMSIQEWAQGENVRNLGNYHQAVCNNERSYIARQQDANRTELNKQVGSMQRDSIISSKTYVAQNCTPYGR